MSSLYILREGFSGFGRAKLATIGSIITIILSLLLLGAFYVVSTNTARIGDSVRERVEMEAFLQEPISQQQVDEIRLRICSVEGIDHVQFVSKDDAAKTFQREFGENIRDVLDFNPLPPSFKIFLKEQYRTSSRVEDIQKKIKSIVGVDDVIYGKEMLEFIEKQTHTLNAVGLAIGILIAVSAIFLVSNTIRLSISGKRRSILTMKLVGATRWAVRAPFLVAGILQGLVGGVVAAGIFYYLLAFAASLVSTDLALFIHVSVLFYPSIVILGMALGLFGSGISVRRFIRESV